MIILDLSFIYPYAIRYLSYHILHLSILGSGQVSKWKQQGEEYETGRSF